MYWAHPNLRLPPDEARVWRYLDFTRFVSLMLCSSIHFTRADKFSDRAEATIPRADWAAARQWTADLFSTGAISRKGAARYLAASQDQPPAAFGQLDEAELVNAFLRSANSALFVNCWHVNETESAAMWDTYLALGVGVAIESTVGQLRDELNRTTEDLTVTLGLVTYLDYQVDSWGPYDPYHPVFHKRSSFDHERELRAVVVRPTFADLNDPVVEQTVIQHTGGLDVKVDLPRLITRLWISPRGEAWFPGLVVRVLERLGISIQVVRSTLYDLPDWTSPTSAPPA